MATPKYRKPPPAETVDAMEQRTHQEHEPDSDADILRELGHGLIPTNGDGPEVQD